MTNWLRPRAVVIEQVLDGEAQTAPEQRRAAFANTGVAEPARALIDEVARHAYRVTDEDVAAVKAAGVSEDAIFELVVSAALGQATRQLDAALAALDIATVEE